MSRRIVLSIVFLAAVGFLTLSWLHAKGTEVNKTGLVGIQYGSEDFSDPQNFVKLSSLDQQWGKDDGFGKQWAGKWHGFLVGPATGDVMLAVETDQDAIIEIGGTVALNTKKGLKVGRIKMVKGEKYSIVLSYVKEGSEYECGLKVQWSWTGQAENTIGGNSLVYSEQMEAELEAAVVAAASNADKDGDSDEGKVDVLFSDLPAAVRKTMTAELDGAVIDDIERDTEDGRVVYEIEAKMSDGRDIKLKVAENGTLLDKDIEAPFHTKERSLVEGVILPNSDTTALWLFDERDYPHTTLTDASEYAKADLCLMGGGRMVDGRFGNALQISGSDYALCYAGFAGKVSEEELRERDGTPSGLWGPTEGPEALLNALSGDRWTVELWLNLSSTTDKVSIIDMGQAYEPGMSLTLNDEALLLVNHYAGVMARCAPKLIAGKWLHLAIVRSGSKVDWYIDGRKDASTKMTSVVTQQLPDLHKPEDRENEHRGFKPMNFERRRQNRFNLAIGSDRHGGGGMKGLVDEMRISKVARYSGRFKPESFSNNYIANPPTPSVVNGPPLLFDPKPVSIPLQFGARKYVFIDDAIIEKKEGMQITMNQPGGREPIVKDFKIKKSAWRPSLFDVDGAIYMAIPEGYSSNEGLTFLATSGDGLDFRMKGRIIPETPMYGAFFKDLNPDAPLAERYKVNAFVANRGMYFYTSPDGRNWRRNETIQLPLRSGGGGECFWDDQHGRYASYIKRDSSFRTKEYPGKGLKGHRAPVFFTNEILKPWPFKALAKPYFEGWPFPAVTGEGPAAFTAREYGWVYRTRAIKYPWAPDVYLAFIWRYPGDDKARHVELAISRNGEDWGLFGTNWYIPTGAAEEELTMYGLIRRGDEIWQYVNEGGPHGGDVPRRYVRYKQRLDGFVSLDAGAKVGTATTLPLIFEGSKLILNIKANGWAKVAITDEAGKIIPGFDFDDCDGIKGDFVDKVVHWKSGKQLKEQQGKTVRLKFRMQNTKLYAFETTN